MTPARPPLDEIEQDMKRHANRTWISLDAATVRAWIEYTRGLESPGPVANGPYQ